MALETGEAKYVLSKYCAVLCLDFSSLLHVQSKDLRYTFVSKDSRNIFYSSKNPATNAWQRFLSSHTFIVGFGSLKSTHMNGPLTNHKCEACPCASPLSWYSMVPGINLRNNLFFSLLCSGTELLLPLYFTNAAGNTEQHCTLSVARGPSQGDCSRRHP